MLLSCISENYELTTVNDLTESMAAQPQNGARQP